MTLEDRHNLLCQIQEMILEVVDISEQVTRSDLQGIAMAKADAIIRLLKRGDDAASKQRGDQSG